MRSTRVKIALILMGAIVSVVGYLALVLHNRAVVPEEVAKVAKAPDVPLPFSYSEHRLTDWSGLIGGATPDAKPVKTVVIPAPVK